MDDLSQILKIRQSRYDRLMRAETEARELYNKACQKEKEDKQKIVDYQFELAKMEVDLLEGLINSPVDQNGLDQVFKTLENAKDEAVNLKNEHNRSVADVKNCEKAVNEAWQQRVDAKRKLDKMTQLNELQLEHQKVLRRKKEQSTIDSAVETMLAFKCATE